MTLGEKIKFYREKMKWTQRELAEKLFLSDKAIGNYETDTRLPSVETLKEIAKALNIPVSRFFEEELKEKRIETSEPLFRFLIVDNPNFTRTILKGMISSPFRGSACISEASTSLEAMEILKENDSETNGFDAIFINLNLPDKDGFELTKEILSFDSDACIFICSSLKSDGIRNKTLEIGAKAFIEKPYHVNDVLTKLSEQILSDWFY